MMKRRSLLIGAGAAAVMSRLPIVGRARAQGSPGKCVLMIGQSLMLAMFTEVIYGIAALPGTYMWNSATSTWVTPTGDGARAFLNSIKTETGEDVYAIPAAVGGTPTMPVNGSISWSVPGPGTPLTNAITWTQAALASLPGLVLNRVEYFGSQSDAYQQTYPDMFTAVLGGHVTLLGHLRAAFGNDFRFCVWPLGSMGVGSFQQILRAQLVFATQAPYGIAMGVEPGAGSYTVPYVDGMHATSVGYWMIGTFQGRNAASYFNAPAATRATVPHLGAGPQVKKIERWTGSTRAMVYFDVKPGGSVVPDSQWTTTGTDFANCNIFWAAPKAGQLYKVESRLIGGVWRIVTPSTLTDPVGVGVAMDRGWGGVTVWDTFGQPLLPHTTEMATSN